MNNIIGEKYNRLTVISEAPRRNGRRYLNCVCDCGNETTVSYSNLVGGQVKSCGCLKKEIASAAATNRNYIHGEEGTHLYRVWSGMKTRCSNPKHVFFNRYGGRGISVCDEWLTFKGFSEWAHANGFREGLSLDRIDNDKGYSPENCRWVPKEMQQRNRTTNHYVTIDGVTLPLISWAEKNGISYNTVLSRIRYGWSDVSAVTVPSARRVIHE